MFAINLGRKPIEGLSQKELASLQMHATGMTAKEIARALCRSVSTIVCHDKSVLAKLGARNMTQAVHEAHKRGYLN